MHLVSSISSRVRRRASPNVARAVLACGAHKEIKFSNKGRTSILKGVELLANVVSTLEPKGLFFPLTGGSFLGLLTCRIYAGKLLSCNRSVVPRSPGFSNLLLPFLVYY